jgi:hypothetical protein
VYMSVHLFIHFLIIRKLLIFAFPPFRHMHSFVSFLFPGRTSSNMA